MELRGDHSEDSIVEELTDRINNRPSKHVHKPRRHNRRHVKRHSKRRNKHVQLLDVSENLTDNSASINKICQHSPTYLSQFEPLTFDSIGLPSAVNDTYLTNDKGKLAELERKLSYDGGWSDYDKVTSMTYGIVPDDELCHDNMVPFFKKRGGYGSNDLRNNHVSDYKNELFTGTLNSTYRNKNENMPLFEPVPDLSYPFGTPVLTEEQISRHLPGRYRQNEKLFDEIRVTPGVNLGANEIGTHGYQSMYRALPRNIDELRVASKPRISYEGRVVAGMKGVNRPIQAPVISYRPPSFKVNTDDDMLPTLASYTGPYVRENYIMRDTDRQNQSIEYCGGAYIPETAVGRNVPEYMLEKHKESTRQNFVLPIPLQKYARDEAIYNPNNLNSFDLPDTARSQTEDVNYIINPNTATRTYTNPMDITNTTLRETTSQPHNFHVGTNTVRGTVHHVDVANPTMRETLIENRLNPHVNQHTMQRVYQADVARTTTRETADEPVAPINPYATGKTYVNPQDVTRNTLRETTVGIPYPTYITPVNQQQGAIQSDITRPTLRETMIDNTYQFMITPHKQPTLHHQDIARTTIKEGTAQIPLETFIAATNQGHAITHQDVARSTLRETIDIPYHTFITPVNQHRGTIHQEPTRPTIRETTVDQPYHTFITSINQSTGPTIQDTARSTTRDTTVEIPYHTFITGQTGHQLHPQDTTRSTTRDTTVEIPYHTFITPINQSTGPTIQDTARSTIRDTTIDIPYHTFITGQTGHQLHPQDTARSTTRDTTVEIPYHTFITGQTGHQLHPQDTARSTTRDTTVEIPYHTFITGQTGHQLHPQDITRPTLRESTVDIPYHTFITPVNQSTGPTIQDISRPTLRETTVETPYHTYIQGNGYKVPLQDGARSTIRETTVDIPHHTYLNVTTGPRTHYQDDARPTLRESTIEIPYTTHITGHQQIPLTSRNPLRSTLRETTVEVPYTTHLTGQPAPRTYRQDPLDATLRETTIDNNYIGIPVSDIHGYGYLAEHFDAPNTNKQFTCQETYIAPLTGAAKMKSYMAAHNAMIDDRKEQTQVYRSPTNSGVNKAPMVEQINVALKRETFTHRDPIIGYRDVTEARVLPQMGIKLNNPTITADRFIDPMLIEQLKHNPYSLH